MVRLQNLIAFMHWVQDCVRTNTNIDADNFKEELMNIAHKRAEFRQSFASQTDVSHVQGYWSRQAQGLYFVGGLEYKLH